MKKIIILAALVGLTGCTEDKTGLQKNVINTGFEKCTDYLTSSLKSPSSLRIGEVAVFVQKPEVQDVYNVFGGLVVKDAKIKEIVRDNKRRFREMLIAINYEAQNSYGVYLSNTYQCQYLFELNNDETSPEPLNTYLIKLKGDGEDMGLGVHIPIADFTGSNWVLNKQIKKLISTADSKFTATDEEMYKELIKQKEYADQELEAERIRKSWDSLSTKEAAEQAAADATAAAEAALGE